MRYPLFKVHINNDKALAEISKVFDSGFLNEGVTVNQFQEDLMNFLLVDNLVLTNSCTSALTMALRISGVGPGSDVVTTPMTCLATNTPIINLGAKIIWADIDASSGNIDHRDIERKVSKQTKAIVYVDWGGTPAELEQIQAIGKANNIPVIQDAAHAFGAKWNNKPISNFADFTCFSFQAIKHLSCGDGGAIVANDSVHNDLARKLKWFGYDRNEVKDDKGEWKGQRWDADIKEGEVGYKFNMNNIAAAIGISQLSYVENILKLHRANAKIYADIFAESEFITPLTIPQKSVSSFWVYTCLVTNRISRDELLVRLNEEGIGAGLVHLPNDSYSAFLKFKSDLPQTRLFQDSQVSLPCGWWISSAECEFIATRTLEIIKSLTK